MSPETRLNTADIKKFLWFTAIICTLYASDFLGAQPQERTPSEQTIEQVPSASTGPSIQPAEAAGPVATANADTDPSQTTPQADIQKQLDDLKKQVETPDALHYKGVTISPANSFIEAATVYRGGATGGGINTAPTGIPLDRSGQAHTSEFFGSGRQSRIALKAIGKLDNV